MSDFVTVEIEGLDKLEKQLEDLGHKVARKALRNALEAVGDVLLEAQKERVPIADEATPTSKGHEPGTLRDSLVAKVTLSDAKETGSVAVGPNKDGWYGKFSEFGTSREPAKPWMRPAFDSSANQAQETFQNVLAEELERIVNELGEPEK